MLRKGYEALLETARLFEANVVLVIDTERLYQDLTRDLPDFVNIMKLQKVKLFNPIQFVINVFTFRVRVFYYGQKNIAESPANSLFVNITMGQRAIIFRTHLT